MEKSRPLPSNIRHGSRAMMFIDGENLAIRYKHTLASQSPMPHVLHIPDIILFCFAR